jgi:hypothetical protein
MSAPQGTRNDEALQAAATLVSYAQQLIQLYNAATAYIAHSNQRAYATTFAALPTYTAQSDGTQGTDDGTPVASHPIKNVNLSSTDLAVLLSNLQGFKTYLETGAPTQIAQLLTRIA